MRITFFAIISLLICATSWGKTPFELDSDSIAADTVEVKAPRTDYNGIDVSKYQGNINWAAIAKNPNIEFVYIKATEGATYVDPNFERNIAQARKHGVKVGCYHFLRSSSTIKDQFENIKKHIRREDQTFVPMIDVETRGKWSKEQLVDSLHALAVMYFEHYHCAPIIYTYANFYNKYLVGRFTNYPLFIARYTDEEPVLNDGTNYVIWQWSERGKVDGIRGNVDLNRFGNGYSVHDILITHQRIKGTTGLDISPEDLVMHPSTAKISEMPNVPTTETQLTEEQLAKLRQQEEANRELQKKEAERRAKVQAQARRKQASDNARQGLIEPSSSKKAAKKSSAKKKSDDDEGFASSIGSFFSNLFKGGSDDDSKDNKNEKGQADNTIVQPAVALDANGDTIKIEVRERKTSTTNNSIKYSTKRRND